MKARKMVFSHPSVVKTQESSIDNQEVVDDSTDNKPNQDFMS
jgi:hypothetical protein